jgi:hypothetical protein
MGLKHHIFIHQTRNKVTVVEQKQNNLSETRLQLTEAMEKASRP